MLRELFNLFRSSDPLKELGNSFATMANESVDLVRGSGDIYFSRSVGAEERANVRKRDARINKLERKIRKQVVLHLCVAGNTADVPYCLLLMSLVKDVERIGDYAKELADLVAIVPGPFPEDEVVQQLTDIRAAVQGDLQQAMEIFVSADRERALHLIREGRAQVDQCVALIHRIAHTDYPADLTVCLVLGARFYQRITGHMLNLLSSVVMPLHRLDYYNEDDIKKAAVRDEGFGAANRSVPA